MADGSWDLHRDAIRKLWLPRVVEDTAEHGGTASGPVVRDIVKAYYDKKNKKTQGQVTAGIATADAEEWSERGGGAGA